MTENLILKSLLIIINKIIEDIPAQFFVSSQPDNHCYNKQMCCRWSCNLTLTQQLQTKMQLKSYIREITKISFTSNRRLSGDFHKLQTLNSLADW